jgi:hypothetical protein
VNTLSNNPTAILHVAHQTIADRLHEAEARGRLRARRAHRRADRRARRRAHLPVGSVRTSPTSSLAKPAQ